MKRCWMKTGKNHVKNHLKQDWKQSWKHVEGNMFFYKNNREFASANIVGDLTCI